MGEDPTSSVGVIEYRRPGLGRNRRVRSFGEEASKVAALATLFVYYGLHASREKGADLFFVCGLLLWLGIGIAIAMRRWRRWHEVSQNGATSLFWRVSLASLIVATLMFFVFPFHTPGRYTCPHGMRWANNQLGIAWSANGGPCGNGPYQRVGRSWRISRYWYVYRPHAW